MKVLVTGGAGFIGSHIVDLLVDEGHEVFVIDDFSTGREENRNEAARYYELDIRNMDAKNVVASEKPEAIFHLAAQINVRTSVENPYEDASVNILGSLNILEGARKAANNPRVIFISTGGAIYGDTDQLPTEEDHEARPLSPYGLAKYVVERYLEQYRVLHSIPYVALRFANIYGPRQNVEGEAGVVAIFAHQLLRGVQPVITGDGSQTRDFVYVEDAARAALAALTRGERGPYNIGTEEETSINELFDVMQVSCGTSFKREYMSAREGDVARSVLSNKKAREAFGWEPRVTLADGIEKTVRSFSLDLQP